MGRPLDVRYVHDTSTSPVGSVSVSTTSRAGSEPALPKAMVNVSRSLGATTDGVTVLTIPTSATGETATAQSTSVWTGLPGSPSHIPVGGPFNPSKFASSGHTPMYPSGPHTPPGLSVLITA